jgi:branched-chain amino acid aminotransferase
VDKGRVFTLEANALPGISMQTVKALTDARADIGIDAHWLQHQCEEVWLTGTPFCMLPVVSLDGKPIGDGTPGPVFTQTLAKWSKLVGVDIQRQIQEWDAQRINLLTSGG